MKTFPSPSIKISLLKLNPLYCQFIPFLSTIVCLVEKWPAFFEQLLLCTLSNDEFAYQHKALQMPQAIDQKLLQ